MGDHSMIRQLSISILSVMSSTLGLQERATAGPHEGGTIILHANPSIIYTSETESYCGQEMLSSCDDAITRVPADPSTTTVFYALAAFPSSSDPELLSVFFGIDYESERLAITDTGHCGDLEENTSDWPLPGSGTGIVWTTPQTEKLVALRWFAGYASVADQATRFEVVRHSVRGAYFVGDFPFYPEDPVVGFGVLGFGIDGRLPCPEGAIPIEKRSWGALKTRYR